jgi:hypothetical protein
MQILNWRIFLLRCFKWGMGLLLITGCNTNPPKPFSSELAPTEAIAKITEIPNRPVWVRFTNSRDDSPAAIGTDLKVGESIRTEAKARVQVVLKNGVIIRLGGDTDVSINAQNQIQLNRGQIVVWVAKKVTAEIVTPTAIAAITDATLYIQLPQDNKDRQILVLQGVATVRIKDVVEAIMLKAGENLAITANGKTSPPQKLTQAVLNQRFVETKILSGFSSKLAGQDTIEANLQISTPSAEAVTIPYARAAKAPAIYSEPYYEPSRTNRTTDYATNQTSSPRTEPKPDPPLTPAAIAEPAPEIREALPPAEPPPEPVQPEAVTNP